MAHFPLALLAAAAHARTALAAASLAGCLCACAGFPLARNITESDLASIQPGMTQDDVVARLGPPTWVFKVRQEDLTIMNYRYNRNECVIYQVSVRPDHTVRDAGTAQDPICDQGPNDRD